MWTLEWISPTKFSYRFTTSWWSKFESWRDVFEEINCPSRVSSINVIDSFSFYSYTKDSRYDTVWKPKNSDVILVDCGENENRRNRTFFCRLISDAVAVAVAVGIKLPSHCTLY